MAGTPRTRLNQSALSVGPTVQDSVVQAPAENRQAMPTPQYDLRALDRGMAEFMQGMRTAQNTAANVDLLERETTDANQLRDTQTANTREDERLAAQGKADAEAGKPADPNANALRSYAQTYATVKGQNTGASRAQDFWTQVGSKLGPADDFDKAAQQWMSDNRFDTGNPFYDAAAGQQFHQRVLEMRNQFSHDRMQAVRADGQNQIGQALANAQASGTLTPQAIQDQITAFRNLNPMEAAKAGQTVMGMVLANADTPQKMQAALAVMQREGSFAPGVSFATQFPQVFAQAQEHFARRSEEVLTLDGAQAYDGLQRRVMDAKASGDIGAFTGILSDLDKTLGQHGGTHRALALRGQIVPVMGQLAEQQAVFNRINNGMTDPAHRDSKEFTANAPAFFQARGVDPLSAENAPNTAVPQWAFAANFVGRYNAIDAGTKTRLSNALVSPDSPAQAETAYRFYNAVAGQVGEQNVLPLMSEQAQQSYQRIRDLTAGGANIAGVIQGLVPNGRQELKQVPDTIITGQHDHAKAATALNDAASKALNDALNVNGWLNAGATISPEVNTRLLSQIRSGAMAQSNMGAMDLGTLSKQAVEREMSNLQVLPGADGKRVVIYSPPSQAEGVVRPGRTVRNPATGQDEDTTYTAEADLSALQGHLPVALPSRNGLSLAATNGTYLGDLTQRTGAYAVLSQGAPVVFTAGQKIALSLPKPEPIPGTEKPQSDGAGGTVMLPDYRTTRDVELPADPDAAKAALDQAWPNSPFVLMRHTTPQGPAYTLGYRFRFQGTTPTPAERERAFTPDRVAPALPLAQQAGT